MFQAVFQYIRLLWIYLLHAVFLSLLLTKVLRDLDWNWFYVFAPLFVWDGISLLYFVLYLVSYVAKLINDYDDDDYDEWVTFCFPMQSISILTLVFYAVGLPLKVAAEILLCFSLRNSVPFYVPGILFCILFLWVGGVLLLYSLKPALRLVQRRC